MDQDKFGNFIKDIRKKNNLTQKQLADRYNVTYQAVSKWENGKNMPDISLIKQISEDFGISIDEMFDGKVKKNNNNLKYIFIFMIIIIGLIIYIFINLGNDSDFKFKTLVSNCDKFNISGSIAYNNSKSSIYISNIEYCGGNDTLLYDEIECILYEVNLGMLKEISSYSYNKSKKITLEEFLKDVIFVVDNYDKICRDYSDESLNLVIKAKLDDKIVNYEIPLSVKDSCNN